LIFEKLFFEKYFSACFRINNYLLFKPNFFPAYFTFILKNIFWLVSALIILCFFSRIFNKNHHFSKIFFRLVSALIFFKKGVFIKTKIIHHAYIIFQLDSKYQIKEQIKGGPIFL
jgi:hypothetical protein